ncbi:MAG: sodium:solute symporter [Pirellulales bacterium]
MQLAISNIDVAIIAAYLLAVVLFGAWVGRRQRGVNDYLLGDRQLPWWLLLISIVATETSSVTFLSVPGTAYRGDLTFLQLAIGFVVGRYAVVALLLPQYFEGRLLTAYQALDRRFGVATKRLASLLFLVTRSLADGLRLYLTAIVLRLVLFGSDPESPPSAELAFDQELAWAVVFTGTATILYTSLGGIKAVVWTDFIQFFIYLAGATASGIVIAVSIGLGAPGSDWSDVAVDPAKLRVFDLSLSVTQPYTLWAGILGGAFIALASHGADQLMVQRYLSARSLPEAARALKWSGWVVLAQFSGFLLLGLGLAVFYQGREFARADEVFATFIVEELPIGVVGLTLAAVLAAAMSTLSGSLNSLAGAAMNDFYVPLVAPNASPQHQLRVTRSLTVVFGVIQIAVAIAGQYLQSTVVEAVLSIAALTTGTVLGIFLLGALTRRVGQRAALVGMAVGLAGMLYLRFATPIAWTWYSFVGAVVTWIAAWVAQALLPRNSKEHR